MLSIAHYRIVTKLHESNNSLVYRGYREQDQQRLIFKVLKANYPTPEELTRYRQEYEITRSLNLQGVVKTYGLETYQNTLVMFLEDFGGESLRHWLLKQPLTLETVLTLAIRITAILGQIHQQHIIHKDINPSNIVWNPATDELKLIDFGIATRISRENPTIRNPNVLEGTLAYLSPEQTGRMNRSIDYRTDFYSFGVTLYELLTQTLPFSATDALELVHCHMAKRPLPPRERNPAIPEAVSDIVLKLLSKTAEDRYQSCRGIQADLEACLTQLQTVGSVAKLRLAQQDISDQFQIPQKLYGREREVEALLTAFDRIVQRSEAGETLQEHLSSEQPTAALLLVSGYSGIGKTSLVQEIYKPITQRRGYFITGKFDQYQRDIPYSAFVRAFASLIGQLLTETETQLAHWREQFLLALAPNAQVMIEVIPELELIVGPQPPVPKLPPLESQHRFNRVFQNFIHVLTQPHHPLVIFLDDLQWADRASLQLLQLLTIAQAQALLLVATYRENEVQASHPLFQTLETIRQAGAEIQSISLMPLQKADVRQLLIETLHRADAEVDELADLVWAKTNGNPFFINELLHALYVEESLTFDEIQRRWVWSIAEIQQRDITDNVVDLLVNKIQRLPPIAQAVLRRAACIGNRFDLQTLIFVLEAAGILAEPDPSVPIAALKEAALEGLVTPLSDRYKQLELGILPAEDAGQMVYKFAHDRIQQAADSLNSAAERTLIHQQVGQQLLQNIPPVQREQRLFDIVNHLNLSSTLIATAAERYELARLNQSAGEKAKSAAAYDAALRYFRSGLELLPPDSWQTDYPLSLSLSIQTAEAEYLNGNFSRSLELAAIALSQAQDLLDQVKVYELQMQIHISQLEMVQAVEIGLQVMQRLGIPLAPRSKDDMQAIELPDLQHLDDLPIMRDPAKLAAMRILKILCAPVFMAKPEIFPQIIITMIRLCLESGNSSLSAFAYGFYGLLQVGFDQLDTGYQAGLIALRFLDKFDAKELKAKVYNLFNSNIRSWKEHARNSVAPLQMGVQSGLESGDIEWGGYCAANLCSYLFFTEPTLNSAIQQQAALIDLCIQIKQEIPTHFSEIWRQLGQIFQGDGSDPLLLVGESFDEIQLLPRMIAAKSGTVLFVFYVAKTILTYSFGAYPQALQNVALANEQRGAALGFMQVAILNFYHSLALLAAYPQATHLEQQCYLEQVDANQHQLHHWAQHAPMNHQHRLDLVAAEKAKVLGQNWQAAERYDRAIQAARAQGYLHEEALAYERAGVFYLDCQKPLIARTYLQEAHYCYGRWGATAKANELEQRFPQLLSPAQSAKVTVPNLTTFITTAASGRSETLDLATVMKASQVLSGELNLQKLLVQLMTIMLENAGAQRGTLLLERHGQLWMEATGTADPAEVVVQRSPLQKMHQQLPISLIQYVARTQEHVVLADATQEPTFATDSYIQTHQPQSVLCMPIQGQGKLIGVLYLENNLTSAVFTVDRLAVLRLLTCQAAIALENAQLYEQLAVYSQTLEGNNQRLEQEVGDRRHAEAQLKVALSEKEVLLKEVHHRVKNNLQIISGLLQLQAQSVTDPGTINILRESQHRVESMSLIHKKLYSSSDFGQIDLADYIPSLATNLLMSYQIVPGTVSLQMSIDPITLNIDQAIPCGLVVNELISNALKYAFPDGHPGEIQVHLHTTADAEIELIIQDNGVGLPETIDWEYTQSLGLSLVRDLVIEQLEGHLMVERQAGTTFKIQFPQAPLVASKERIDE